MGALSVPKLGKETYMKLSRDIRWDKEAVICSFSEFEEWNKRVDTLDWEEYIPFECTRGVRTSRSFWLYGRWSFEFTGQESVKIYVGYEIDHHEIWIFNENNNQSIRGFEARKILVEKMFQTNGKKLQARFGALNGLVDDDLFTIQAIHNINRCVGPFIGNASFKKNVFYESSVYKADVSSAYPGEGIYKLPDLRTAQIFDEYIEPSEEWPIVFYLEHHHIAEYGRFDTHKDQFHPLYRWYRGNGKKPRKTSWKKERPIGFTDLFTEEPELCLCCKYSDYNLEEFLYFYEQKSRGIEKEREEAKAVMNLAIGTFDFVCTDEKGNVIKSKSTYFGHLRALICARHNHNMIQYYDEIVRKGYEVLQVQTDSIIWRGGPIESAIDEKKIGKLHLEIEDGRVFIHGCGAYWIEDKENKIEKHQGIKNFPKDVNSLEEFKKFFENGNPIIEDWKLNSQTLKYELMEV